MAKRKQRSLEEVQAVLAEEVAELKEIGLVKWVRLNPRKAVIAAAVLGAVILFLSAVFGAAGTPVPSAADLGAVVDLR